MRFSIDAHAIGRNLTGNEVYVRNLLAGFASLDVESEFFAYVSEPGAERDVPAGFRCRRVSSNPFVRLGLDLSARLREDRPDLIHVQYTAPLWCPCPIVVSVHDVSFLEHPEYFPRARVLQLGFTVRRTVERAARVLTTSEFSARQLARQYSIAREKITVVPCAVSSAFRPIAQETARARVRQSLGVPAPYLLMVGDLQPRKNQTGLIAAFEQLLRDQPHLPHHLVLTGQDNFFASRAKEAARQSSVPHRIHFTGFVPDSELPYLYAGCDLFVFPSLYEGFGMPILEAMACGRAVVCSNTTATVEVADGAAITCDPTSTAELVRAMRDVLVDGELRARMERLGVKRAARFQWKDTAAKTLTVYHEVAAVRRRSRSAASVRR